jgi:hypothetical protein
MQLLGAVLGALALVHSAAASPIQTPEIVSRGEPVTTSATVTNFKVSRNNTHINYAATIQVHPNGKPLVYTHATKGAEIPETSNFWDSPDPDLYFRFNRVPSAAHGEAYRLVLTDAEVIGRSINLAYISPAKDWSGKYGRVYTGPAEFKLE